MTPRQFAIKLTDVIQRLDSDLKVLEAYKLSGEIETEEYAKIHNLIEGTKAYRQTIIETCNYYGNK